MSTKEMRFDSRFVAPISVAKTKIHSIRRDPNDKYVEGEELQMVDKSTGNVFATKTCTGTQKILIKCWQREVVVFEVQIDDRTLEYDEVQELARNDGFSSAPEMIEYVCNNFNYIGKIVHWTDKRY